MNLFKNVVGAVLMLGVFVGVNAQQKQKANYDLEFVQFHFEDTVYLVGTGLLDGYIKNNGPDQFQGSLQLNFLVTDTITYPSDIGNYNNIVPAFAVTVSNLNISAGDSTYFQKNIYIDDQSFQAQAKHGTLIWPTMYYTGPDSSYSDSDTTNHVHTDSTYVLAKQTGLADNESRIVFKIFPNPVQNTLHIQLTSSVLKEEGMLSLMNQQGQSLQQWSLQDVAEMKGRLVIQQRSGVYYLRLVSGGNEFIKKLILIK